MQKTILLFGFILLAFHSMGQIKEPVKWNATSNKKAGSYEIVITATLPEHWHIYSQSTGEGGPVATSFKFTKNPLLTFRGRVKELGALKENYDKLFGTQVKYYNDKVTFVQGVKVKGNVKTNVDVTVEFMACNNVQCLPPAKKSFNVSL